MQSTEDNVEQSKAPGGRSSATSIVSRAAMWTDRLTLLDPVYAHSNPIFFEGGLQSTIIIFAKTNPFLPAVRDCGVMRANGGWAVITRARLRAPIAVSAARAQARCAHLAEQFCLAAAVTIAVSLWHHNHYCTFMFNSLVTTGTPCFLIFLQ